MKSSIENSEISSFLSEVKILLFFWTIKEHTHPFENILIKLLTRNLNSETFTLASLALLQLIAIQKGGIFHLFPITSHSSLEFIRSHRLLCFKLNRLFFPS